jgi:hypothetical protein
MRIRFRSLALVPLLLAPGSAPLASRGADIALVPTVAASDSRPATPFATGSAASTLVPAVSHDVVVEGRYAPSDRRGVRLGFPGVAFHLAFHGRSLGMRVESSNDDAFFDVEVDGGPATRVRGTKGVTDVALVDGAADGDHRVVVTRRNESWMNVCEVVGFVLGDGGRLLDPPPLPTRKLMFVGDSVTCGQSNDVRPDDPRDRPGLAENARVSYGKLLAARFNTQCFLVSYGGRGVIREWQGIRATNNAPEFYELAVPDDPASHWDHHRYVPDGIGICLGTNDFSRGIPDETEFVLAYVELVRKIRRDAPDAPIVLIDSPMVDDPSSGPPRHTVLRAYLAEVASRLRDPKVTVAQLSHVAGVPGDGHPSGAEHVKIADELEPVFRRVLGW